MFKLDESFLVGVGLGDMPKDQQKAFLQHLYEELELRVGLKLSEGMSKEQLKEFSSLIDKDEDDAAIKWLETNRPNFKDTVGEELEKIRKEVLENKDQILSQEKPGLKKDDQALVA